MIQIGNPILRIGKLKTYYLLFLINNSNLNIN